MSTGISQTRSQGLLAGAYTHYSFFLVFVVLVLAQVDRVVLSVLVEDIRLEFDISDTQIGLLSGFAFSAFYAIMGVPIARIADLGNRRTLIAACLALWSLMTAISGMAQNYIQLFIARVGLGVGEAGAQPAGNSLAADYYAVEHRGKVATVIMLSSFFGSVIGYSLGGELLTAFGWRKTLIILGLPGVIIAALIFFTLSEPRRVIQRPKFTDLYDRGARDALAAGFRKKCFIHILMGTMAYAFFAYGAGIFNVPFYIRNFGMTADQVGNILGPVMGLSGLLGAGIAYFAVDRLAKRDLNWLLKFPAILCFLASPLLLLAYNAATYRASFTFLFFGLTILSAMIPGLIAAIYGVAGQKNRSMAMAVLAFFMNFFGMGLGPLITGMISDALSPVYPEQGLRFSLSFVTFILVWAGVHLFIGVRTLKDDFEDKRPDLP